MNEDIILRNEQKTIHNDPNILLKHELIMNLFEKRLSNASNIEPLTHYINDRKKAYCKLYAGFAPPKRLFSQIDVNDESRRIRLLTRNERKVLYEASNSFLDDTVSFLINLGHDLYGNKFYVNSNLTWALTVDYLVKKNGKCRINNILKIEIYPDKVYSSLLNLDGTDIGGFTKESILNFQRQLRACRRTETEAEAIVIDLHIFYFLPGFNTGHSNLLIYRPQMNTVERFEPHGSFTNLGGSKSNTAKVNLILNNELENITTLLFEPISPGIRFISSELTCPIFGPQLMQINDVGYCRIWSLLMTEMIIKFPMYSTIELNKGLIDSVVKYTQNNDWVSSGLQVGINMTNLIKGYLLTIESYMDILLEERGIDVIFVFPNKDDPSVPLLKNTDAQGQVTINEFMFKSRENVEQLYRYLYF